MTTVHAWAVQEPKGKFQSFTYESGAIGDEEVEIDVIACGLCHSDLSMWANEWGTSTYPLVPGHEVIGRVAALGSGVKSDLKIGQIVGLGWFSSSCLHCHPCLSGDHNLCNTAEQTIVGRYGGFADRVRCHWLWAIPLPEGVDTISAGPLFCGGITVFNPIIQCNVKPTDHVGVIGIGGLGHMALRFLNKWGCDVTAFTSSDSKHDEALALGAHHVINSRDEDAIRKHAGRFDFVLSTVNVTMNWGLIINTLKPRGRLHTVGAVLEPIPVAAFSLIGAQRSLSGSPLGSPETTAKMLEFCARHGIAPQIEKFKMADINEAFAHLESGKARYRIVLEN